MFDSLKTYIEAPELDAVVEELDSEWQKVISELSKKAGAQDRQAKLSPKYDQKDRLNVIYALIEESQSRMIARRETKVGKTKAWFHKVAESVNSHKYLFDLLPHGDKYTTLLVGALTATIKVRLENTHGDSNTEMQISGLGHIQETCSTGSRLLRWSLRPSQRSCSSSLART